MAESNDIEPLAEAQTLFPPIDPSESADARYWRSRESFDIARVILDRSIEERLELIEGADWQLVDNGAWADDLPGFLNTYGIAGLGATDDQVKRFEVAARRNGATYRAIGGATGQGVASVHRHLNHEPVPDGTEGDSGDRENVPDQGDLLSPNDEPVPDGTEEDLDEEPRPADDASEEGQPDIDPKDEWYTPKALFDGLGLQFDLDVCAPIDRTHSAVPANGWYTIEDDGLSQKWSGLVWCNPPYSNAAGWARRMIRHRNGLLLTHVPMNAEWCVEVWDACDSVRFFQGMDFVRPDGTTQRPAWWLQLAAFGDTAVEALAQLEPFGDVAHNRRRIASPMFKGVAP